MKTDATNILVIDDEEAICYAFQRYFASRGGSVVAAAGCRAGLEACRRLQPDVVFLDLCLPDGSGLDLLEPLHAAAPAAKIIVITAFGSLEAVIRAIQGKAFDYLVKPLDLDRAGELVARVLASRRAPLPPAAAPEAGEAPLLVGRSRAIQEVFKRIGLVARTETAVLILGETGTGKELVASAIHRHSRRQDGPFVAVNCAALPESLVESELFGHAAGAFTGARQAKPGRFEAAHGGTLFLDEIGELPPPMQVKLLRFLDTQTIERLGTVEPVRLDVRILAATNRDLPVEIREKRFREDLFYRLAVLQIELPPLRERLEDIPLLAAHFLRALQPEAAPPPMTREFMAALTAHSWPGNVRELRNAIGHAAVVAAGAPLLPEHLPPAMRQAAPDATRADADLEAFVRQLDQAGGGNLHQRAVDALEKVLMDYALAKTGGNQSAAAEFLGVHRNTLRNKRRGQSII